MKLAAKDYFGIAMFLTVFAAVVFFAPDYLGHADNYIEANPLQTPPHIVPEWYFLPFYAILRAIPDKLMGVLAMFGAIAVLFVLRPDSEPLSVLAGSALALVFPPAVVVWHQRRHNTMHPQ